MTNWSFSNFVLSEELISKQEKNRDAKQCMYWNRLGNRRHLLDVYQRRHVNELHPTNLIWIIICFIPQLNKWKWANVPFPFLSNEGKNINFEEQKKHRLHNTKLLNSALIVIKQLKVVSWLQTLAVTPTDKKCTPHNKLDLIFND